MTAAILCRLGLHRWLYSYAGPKPAGTPQKCCERCWKVVVL
jgi:hypothetical protein